MDTQGALCAPFSIVGEAHLRHPILAGAKNHLSPLVQEMMRMPIQQPAGMWADIFAGYKHTSPSYQKSRVWHHRLPPAEFTARPIGIREIPDTNGYTTHRQDTRGPCKHNTSEGAIVFATAKDAEQTFYRAFAAADFRTMKTVWADQDIACIHPGGEVLLGPQEVLDSWGQILMAQGAVNLRVEMLYRLAQGQQVIHVVREHFGNPPHNDTRPVVATNIYRREQDGWRMRLHHASIDAALGPTVQRVSLH